MEQQNKFEFKKNKCIFVVAGLLCLNIYTCTNSCSRQRALKKDLKAQIEAVDSMVKVTDRIKNINDSLEKNLTIVNTEKKGLEQSINIQNEAINQITAAKKNINVTIKEKK